MFEHRDVKVQLVKERQRNEELKAKTEKLMSDMEYMAMMSGIELDQEEQEEQENGEEE